MSVCAPSVTSPLPPIVPALLVMPVAAVMVVAPLPLFVSLPEVLSMDEADTVAVAALPDAPFTEIVPLVFESAPPAFTDRLPSVCTDP